MVTPVKMTCRDCGASRWGVGAAQEKAPKARVATRVRAKERIVKRLWGLGGKVRRSWNRRERLKSIRIAENAQAYKHFAHPISSITFDKTTRLRQPEGSAEASREFGTKEA